MNEKEKMFASESRLMQARGLKLKKEHFSIFTVMSRLMQARGLKQ